MFVDVLIPRPTVNDIKAIRETEKVGLIEAKRLAEKRWRKTQIAACRSGLANGTTTPEAVAFVLLDLMDDLA